MDLRDWLSILARAPHADLVARAAPFEVDAETLRAPEIGAVMMRGRIAGTGAPFNLGEITVTRCALRAGGRVGHGTVQGRSPEAARAAAMIDIAMQGPAAHPPRQRSSAPPGRAAGPRGGPRRQGRGDEGRLLHPRPRRRPMTGAAALGTGFADPARDGARALRAILEAMARPGRILSVQGPAAPGLSPAAAAALLTLADADAPAHLAGPAEAATDWLAFQTGARIAAKAGCAFAAGPWDALAPLSPYPAGTPDYPDRSATLVVEMPALSEDGPALSGPGIPGTITLSLPDPEALRANAARFPLGLDLILCAGDRLAALPRSTRIARGTG